MAEISFNLSPLPNVHEPRNLVVLMQSRPPFCHGTPPIGRDNCCGSRIAKCINRASNSNSYPTGRYDMASIRQQTVVDALLPVDRDKRANAIMAPVMNSEATPANRVVRETVR